MIPSQPSLAPLSFIASKTASKSSNPSIQSRLHLPHNISIGGNIIKSRIYYPKRSTNIMLTTTLDSEALKYIRYAFTFTLDPVYLSPKQRILQKNTIRERSIANIGRALIKIKYITHLSLRFQSPESVTEDILRSISQTIRRLKFLSNITLDFGRGAMHSYIAFKNFLSSLLTLPKLHQLALVIANNQSIDGENILALSKVLRRKQSLSMINLHFESQSFDDNCLKNLTLALIDRSKLIRLSLILSNIYDCTAGIADYIGDLLTSCTSLTHLKLKFPNVVYTHGGQLQYFFTRLKSLKALKSLQLSLAPAEGVSRHLKEGLSYLTNLKSLYIAFDEFTRKQEFDLTGLEVLQYLTDLSIVVSNRNNIGREEF